MSLFGTSPPNDSPSISASTIGGSRSLFDDDEPVSTKAVGNSLFSDDFSSSGGGGSPWDMPTPRKQQSRGDLLRNLLPASDVPDSYIETFDTVVAEDGSGGKVIAAGVAKLFASARLSADKQAEIMTIVAPSGQDIALGRNEFNVLLALVGLAQDGDIISLDGVDERRRSKLLSCPPPPLAGWPLSFHLCFF
jgi:sorting nexin-8